MSAFFLPGFGIKEHQHRKYLKSAEKHIKGKHQLGEPGEASEIAHRTYNAKAGTYIVEAGDNRRCISGKVEAVYRNGYCRHYRNNHIHHKIGKRITGKG